MPAASDDLEFETRIARADQQAIKDDSRPGKPSHFGCPECGGVLWELESDQIVRFRCRVGHAYSAESLLASQTEGLEAALWSALRSLDSLEERASLTRRLSERATEQAQHAAARRFSEQMRAAEAHTNTIRTVLLTGDQPALSSAAAIKQAHQRDDAAQSASPSE